jgi:hypothetical protein
MGSATATYADSRCRRLAIGRVERDRFRDGVLPDARPRRASRVVGVTSAANAVFACSLGWCDEVLDCADWLAL